MSTFDSKHDPETGHALSLQIGNPYRRAPYLSIPKHALNYLYNDGTPITSTHFRFMPCRAQLLGWPSFWAANGLASYSPTRRAAIGLDHTGSDTAEQRSVDVIWLLL
jgi:hypothetical protein